MFHDEFATDVGTSPKCTVALQLSRENIVNSLVRGVALKEWWMRTDARNGYHQRFPLIRTFNQADTGFGFFDEVDLGSHALPVMGTVDDELFDHLKSGNLQRLRAEFREFVLHYFLRVSDFRQPTTYIDANKPSVPSYLSALSWCPDVLDTRTGFGYSQICYERCDSGEKATFPEEQRFSIVDVRELGKSYSWVVLKVGLFDFQFAFRPLGPQPLEINVPLDEETMVVLGPAFIHDEDNPEPGVLGRYCFGYAILNQSRQGTVRVYGPGHFESGFSLFDFRVYDTGEIRMRRVFLVNRPERVLNVPLNPLSLGWLAADAISLGAMSRCLGPLSDLVSHSAFASPTFDPLLSAISLTNLVTGGLSEQLCISRRHLEMDMLVQHSMQNYVMTAGALRTWRQIPDWLDAASLPDWIVTGVTS